MDCDTLKEQDNFDQNNINKNNNENDYNEIQDSLDDENKYLLVIEKKLSYHNKKQQQQNILTYEEFLEKCGGFGAYQIMLSIILILAFTTGNFIVFDLPFLEKIPQYECRESPTSTIWSKCSKDQICKNDNQQLQNNLWRIDYSQKDNYKNWVSPQKLDLTCKPSYLIGLIGSIYFLGFSASAGIVPYLSDQFGRKIPYSISMFIQNIAYLIIILSKDIYITIGGYLIVGLCAGGRVAIGTTYLSEFIPFQYQNLVTTLLNAVDGSIMFFQALFYYFFNDWYPLHQIGLAYGCLIFLLIQLIPESPKFLYAKKKYDQARSSLKYVAKINNQKEFANEIERKFFDTEFKLKLNEQNINNKDEIKIQLDQYQNDAQMQEIKLEGKISELCKIKFLRTNTFVLISLLSLGCFNFFLIIFQVKNFRGNLIYNTFAEQSAEISATLISGYIYMKTGPKLGFCSMYFVSLIGSVLLLYIMKNNHLRHLTPIVLMISKFGVSAAFNMSFIASVQLIPTVFAATVFGFCNVIARLSTVLAPQIAEINGQFPIYISIVCCILAAIISLLIEQKMPNFV